MDCQLDKINGDGDDVFVSLIIPVKNEGCYIRNCLDSIFDVHYPKDRMEVILVDNGSEDNTIELASQYPVRIISAPGLRIGAVRNRGAAAARGTILAYVDGDCIVPSCWISAALENLARDEVAAVGGVANYPDNPTWIERAWALKKEPKRVEVKSLATGSFIIKKAVFDEVGGFDEELIAGEDTEISRSIIQARYTLVLEPRVSVTHLGYPRTIKQFVLRQIWQTSDYLRTLNSRLDKIFILTHVFLLLGMAALFMIATGMVTYAGFCLLMLIAIPCLVSAIKISRSIEARSLSLFIQVCFVHFLYFAGRSFGLLISYKRYLIG